MSKHSLPENYRPSVKEAERYLHSWKQQPRYFKPQNALDKLFQETYKKNDNLDEVLIKCSALNTLYSTNVFDVYSMAKHIQNLGIDERLSKADYSLVKDIATLKSRYFYSFASKYCSHHLHEEFAIYDSYVEIVLVSINKNEKTHFACFKKEELKDYYTFMRVLQAFRMEFGLTQYSIRELDHYIWQLGKTYFDER